MSRLLDTDRSQDDNTLANAAIKELKASAGSDHTEGNKEPSRVLKEWDAEADALAKISELRHAHIVPVKAIITKGSKSYFMFQWADGGSLRDLFMAEEKPALTKDLVWQIVKQVEGLADALSKLHNYQKGGSYRHGDLKPENILRFFNSTELGVLKISDMGLAKHHFAETTLRGPTSARYGTPSYEPPEAVTNSSDARSRLYDIWSMGCIVLELIIWLLYGKKELEKFESAMRDAMKNPAPFWVHDKGSGTAKLHPAVIDYINHIREDPECEGSSAIKDLLLVVETNLLVIPLPRNMQPNLAQLAATNPSSEKASKGPAVVFSPAEPAGAESRPHTSSSPDPLPTEAGSRSSSDDFLSKLKTISRNDPNNLDNDKYWSKGIARDGVAGLPSGSAAQSHKPPGEFLEVPGPSKGKNVSEYHTRDDDILTLFILNELDQLKSLLWCLLTTCFLSSSSCRQ